MTTTTDTTTPTFSDVCAAKRRAQARIGEAREVGLDISPNGVFVGYWIQRKNGKGRQFDFHTGSMSFDGAVAYLDGMQ